MIRDEKQAYSRIRRISQKNNTFTWRTLNSSVQVERAIVAKQENVAAMNELSFKEAGEDDSFGASPPDNYAARVAVQVVDKTKKKKKKSTRWKSKNEDFVIQEDEPVGDSWEANQKWV